MLISGIIVLSFIFAGSLSLGHGFQTTVHIDSLPYSSTGYLDELNALDLSLGSYTYGDYDMYTIDLATNEGISVTLDIPSTADFDLYIVHTEGTSIFVDESSTSGTGTNEDITFIPTTSGQYGIVVCAYSNDGTYYLDVDPYSSGVSTSDFPFFLGIIFTVIGLVVFFFICIRCCCGRKSKNEEYTSRRQLHPPSPPQYQQQYIPPPRYQDYQQPPPVPPAQPQEPFPEKGILEPTWKPAGSQPEKIPAPPATALRTCEACGNTLPSNTTLCPLCGYKNPN